MKIAVYSGSFNPLHKGHLAVMKHLVEQAGFDMVYLIVSPQSPFKTDTADPSSGQDRYRAAVQAVARHPELQGRVLVDDIELTMPAPQYTIRTLDALKEREPANDFTLVTGADHLGSILRWREGERILLQYGIAVYPRTGFDCEALAARLLEANPDYSIRLLQAPTVDISSTQIRETLALGGTPHPDWLM